MSIARTSPGTVQPDTHPRLCVEPLLDPREPLAEVAADGADVVRGLNQAQKTLPPRYFYDDHGSKLFEQICALPEYYLTRTETAILESQALDIARTTGECELAELGSGSATKIRLLLDAHRELGQALRFLPIDVNAGILESSARELLGLYPQLTVHGLVGTFELALERLPATVLPTRALCFLGSTLGNLTPAECDVFFTQVAAALKPGEYFLLGVDLHKSTTLLEAAYNDSAGITAEFNLNILHHLNTRFEGNFDLGQFEHIAFYNEALQQVEIYLENHRAQTVALRRLDLTVHIEAGERILTEISRKFDLSRLGAELAAKSLQPVKTWTDTNQWFGLILCRRQ